MWNGWETFALKMEMRQKNVEKEEIISPHWSASPPSISSCFSKRPPIPNFSMSSSGILTSFPPFSSSSSFSPVCDDGGQQASSLSETPRTELYFLVTISVSDFQQLDGFVVFWRSPVGQKVSWHLRNAAKALGVKEHNVRYQVSAKRSWGRF